MNCRHCHTPLHQVFLDLGFAPPSNAYLSADDLRRPELTYPLRLLVCDQCWLVQTQDFVTADDLFRADYAYFSSTSSSWLAHAERYVAAMTERFALGAESHVVEIAANDGYLLQFVQARGIPCTGIEPTRSTAAAARAKGIPIIDAFFGIALAEQLAAEGRQADLMVANNVLAHVPDINDFVSGFARLLKPRGVATFEFPHLLQLIRHTQFDTVYHEHYSYLSLLAVERIFTANGLALFNIEHLPTHGGSLRLFAQRLDQGLRPRQPSLDALLAEERAAGLDRLDSYQGFQARANRVKNDLLAHLLDTQRAGRTIAGYGAAAKGNTLLNYAGVRPDLLPYVCDAAPAKQGKYLPGSHILIRPPDALHDDPPDEVLILPWNIAEEVKVQLADLADLAEQGVRFVTAVPELQIQSP